MIPKGRVMALVGFLRGRFKKSGFLILIILMFFYFSFYTINGDRGLIKYFYLKKEISQASKLSKGYKASREQLEEQVKLLSSSSLDLDLLEERARVVLNFVEEEEFIILDEE